MSATSTPSPADIPGVLRHTITIFHGCFGGSGPAVQAQPPQPQAPPQQPPPPPSGAAPAPDPSPPTATVDSSLTVSSCPAGQAAGAEDSLIGRVSSNVSPQARQRNS